MRDEDSGEAIQCPYCGSEGHCKHLLAVIDRSFLECSGGYAFDRFHEFRKKIEGAFLKKLALGTSPAVKWHDDLLDDLWTYAQDNYSREDEYSVEIDRDTLFRLIVELLRESDGDEYPGTIDDGGAPGFSSAIALFHAASPAAVFDKAIALLAEHLEPKGKARSRKQTTRRPVASEKRQVRKAAGRKAAKRASKPSEN